MKINYLLPGISILLFAITLSADEMTLQPNGDEGKDAWVWSFEPAREINFGVENDSNLGLHNVLRAEVWKWGGKEESDTIRGLLSFDLSAIPSNASVVEAKLSLYFYSNPGYTPQLGNNEFLIQRIIEDWSEEKVTWENQPSTTAHNQITVPASNTIDQDYIGLDVRNLVQELVYFPQKNHGFMLRLKSEVEFNGVTFASSEHTDSSKRPRLYIKYITYDK